MNIIPCECFCVAVASLLAVHHQVQKQEVEEAVVPDKCNSPVPLSCRRGSAARRAHRRWPLQPRRLLYCNLSSPLDLELLWPPRGQRKQIRFIWLIQMFSNNQTNALQETSFKNTKTFLPSPFLYTFWNLNFTIINGNITFKLKCQSKCLQVN